MCAVQNKPKPRELCPSCYKEGIEEDLIYKPGGQFTHFCNKGHQWDDREVLSTALMEMSAAIRAKKTGQPAPPPPAPKVEEAPAIVDDRIKIDQIDHERLKSLLGDFRDSATLFGMVFAMNEQIKDLQEKLSRAEARIVVGTIRPIGGDLPINIQIPERHVQPLKDIAESGAMTVDRFMQARIEDGLDNGWYY